VDGLGNSGSHHRVIPYCLGQLGCVDRFEVDVYFQIAEGQDLVNAAQRSVEDVTNTMMKLFIIKAKPDTSCKEVTTTISKGALASSFKLAELLHCLEEGACGNANLQQVCIA
jgi:hypothetical protein